MKKLRHTTRGIANKGFSGMRRALARFNFSCNLTGNRPHSLTGHTATVMGNLKNRHTTLKFIITIGLLFGLTSCSYYFYPPKVDTRSEIQYSYKRDKNFKTSKWRKTSQKTGYVRYDRKRNIIEEGNFGERKCIYNETKTADSSIIISIGHSYNYKNLNTVHYFLYDSVGKKYQDELWQFKDNKKDYLIYKTLFEYDTSGKLIKEIEYDKYNKISRLQDYSKDNSNQTISKDSVFNFSYMDITRVEGKRQDTTITDSLGRPIEKIHYYKDEFLYRQEFRYDRWGEIVTEIRYKNKPDSLWCITEWQYNYDKQPIRKFWKVIGSKTETKDVYIYNRKKLLVKILHYSGETLEGYTKYKYKLY